MRMGFKSFLLAALTALISPLAVHADEQPLSPDEFLKSEGNIDSVRLRGVVEDAFLDEVDPRFLYYILDSSGLKVLVSVKFDGADPSRLLSLAGRNVEVHGNVRTTYSFVSRAYLGRMFTVSDPSGVVTLGGDPDPFDVPVLSLHDGMLPEELHGLGRRRVSGHVLAVWSGRSVLIRTFDGRPVTLRLTAGTKSPAYGDAVEAVGTVETDTYNIGLSHARWRPTSAPVDLVRSVVPVTAKSLLVDDNGKRRYQSKRHGQVIRLTGVVRGISDIDSGRFEIEEGDRLITIDASTVTGALERVSRGCTVEVTGTCVLDIDFWRPDMILPRIRGLIVIPSLPEDIRVTATAPWLTPGRAWSIVAALCGFLAVVVLWNRILWFKAFKRGRELSREILARAEADMRTRERTRLAVELHDSIVQSLSGVLMELETAKRIAPVQNEECAHHLVIAERTLRSCHADLRNCLWDLRSEALEEPDMSAAIRRTLLPHVKGVSLDVRFNVARSRICDNTAHTILRVVRELALNGIKHGGADHIRIAGIAEDGVLRISVSDNGSGFNPDTAPGIAEGHFGLMGVRERVDALSGKFEIAALPHGGTRAVLTIPLHKGDAK